MKLSNKYNIPQEAVDKMIKDGIIGCQWPMYEEIYDLYLKALNTGKTKTLIYYEIGEKKGIPETSVKAIILKMDKI
jgi:hypothetical protein